MFTKQADCYVAAKCPPSQPVCCKRRKQMSIFARWPALAFLSSAAGLVVQTSIVVQEVMAKVIPSDFAVGCLAAW